MKKRILSLLMAGAMLMSLTACGEDPNAKQYALITNKKTEEKQAYTESAWKSVEKFAGEQKAKCGEYTPKGEEQSDYTDAIDEAVDAGAKVVVCIGRDMSVAVYNAQKDHKKTKFLLMEAEPHKLKSDEPVYRKNTCAVYFDELQEGFLAGYAAVAEGARNIGYMSGKETDRSKKMISGYMQGAETAAKDLGLGEGAVQLTYTFLGDNKLSPAHMGTALDWYKSGCEIIFSPDKEIARSVMKAAENQNKKMIGIDIDRNLESPSVLTSAIKDYAGAVYQGLTSYINDKFPGEQKVVYGAGEKGVSLTLETSALAALTQDKYDAMYQKLADGTTKVEKEMPAGSQVTVTKE